MLQDKESGDGRRSHFRLCVNPQVDRQMGLDKGDRPPVWPELHFLPRQQGDVCVFVVLGDPGSRRKKRQHNPVIDLKTERNNIMPVADTKRAGGTGRRPGNLGSLHPDRLLFAGWEVWRGNAEPAGSMPGQRAIVKRCPGSIHLRMTGGAFRPGHPWLQDCR